MEDVKLFELSPAEIRCPIRFSEGGRRFKVEHVVKPPALADWLLYEQTMQMATEVVDGKFQVENRKEEAAAAIWERIVLTVKGYRVSPDKCTVVELPTSDPQGWKDKVPVQHKAAAIMLLAQVSLVEEPEDAEEIDYVFDPECVVIRLNATRDGETYEDLAHTFGRPNAAQHVRFSRATSRALLVKGSRTQKSIVPTNLSEICKLYDELIRSTQGYSGNGNMDALHKKVAAIALFAPAEGA